MIETPLQNFSLQSILVQLCTDQDFVWLDSADDSGESIIGFDASDQITFKKSDHAAFKKFLESFPVSSGPNQKKGFSGGWIGYLSYESFVFNPLIPIQPILPSHPLAAFKYYKNFISVNPKTNTLTLHTDTYAQRDAVLHRLSTRPPFRERSSNILTQIESDKSVSLREQAPEIGTQSHPVASKYAKDFSHIMDDIASGRYFEINYSFELALQSNRHESWFDIYLNLRRRARAPMMAFLKFDDLHILSASPERFFTIHNGVIQTSPIKGTSARSDDPAEDKRLKTILQNNTKDRAELLMVTDMLRNDIGRICTSGSVITDSLCDVLTLPYYHHLVSHIHGDLIANSNLFDVFCALFPGGSITGAPKISAMQRILELENRSRGVYTGAIGYISNSGTIDFNLAIRTLVSDQNSVRYAVGSGIVSDSTLEIELAECWLKASAFLDLLSRSEIINKTAS